MAGKNIFQRLIVLEFASVLAGPAVGAFFAELGATVIKIENLRTGGDVTRKWKLSTEDPDQDISAYFSCVNWGKYSAALDLKDGGILKHLYNFLPRVDIVIANFKPGDAEKLKVDYDTLKKYNPKLIYAHITGYGPDNPRAGFDAIIQAEAGFTYMNGDPDCGPVKMPVALMDVLAAHQLKEAILVALLEREHTGKGAFLTTSLIQSGVASLVNQATNWLVGGVIPQRMGSDHPNIVPYGTLFETRDGHSVVIAAGTEKQFRLLCEILGDPGLADDPKFKTNQLRVQNRHQLKNILRKLIKKFDRNELLSILHRHGIPAGGVFNMKEVFEQREAKELLLNQHKDDREIKGVRTIAFKKDHQFPDASLNPPPHFGEHTSLVLKNFIGLSDDEINELKEKGLIHG